MEADPTEAPPSGSLIGEENPVYGPFFGAMGAMAAMVFSAMGAAYGTAKSGTGIASMAVMRPELIMKSIIPVVMAGIIAIYGLVVAALIANQLKSAAEGYTLFKVSHPSNHFVSVTNLIDFHRDLYISVVVSP